LNVFRFELRRAWVGAAVWTIVILALLGGLVAGALPTFLDSRAAIEAMLSNFPRAFAAAFGLQLDSIFSFAGFYAFGFVYYSLCGAIMAAGIGLNLFSREKREKCMDFLLSKPRSRGRLFTEKLLAALTLLVVFNALFIAESLALYRAYAPAPLNIGNALLASFALLLTQIVIFAIAVFAAVFAKKVRSVSGAATAIGIAAFLLSAIHSLLEEEKLRYIAPLKYFDVFKAFFEGRFDTPYAVTAAVLTAALMIAAYLRYTRADAPAQ
jgi:ABC-type transport system involved in multi-copper enzyme maturation permease subunit